MSRSRHFLTGLFTGYAAIGVNVLYTITTVPLALHYLSKQEFGLWALITQLSGYLLLLEFGMSGSVARFLSDHKDHINGGEYGSVLSTGLRVFFIQGIFVALLGIGASMAGPRLLDLPSHLHESFTRVMSLQAILAGASLFSRGLVAPLWPNQRNDIINLSGSLSLLVSFITLWICYHLGWKLHSLIAASTMGFVSSLSISMFACHRLGLYPRTGSWGAYDPAIFRQMFHYGSGLFMLNLGFQLLSSSQIIVISRTLGLEAATIWSVATKLGSMVQQFVLKIFDSSAAGLTELLVRNENERLITRFRDIFSLTAVIAAVGAGGIAIFNGPFVDLWTSGKISWSNNNNLLMGGVVFCLCLTRCQVGLVCLHKNLAGMKYATISEGILFIVTAVISGPQYGFPAILVASIASNILVTGWYATARSAYYFDLSYATVARWIARPTVLLLFGGLLHQIFNLDMLSEQSLIINILLRCIAFILYLYAAWAYAGPSNLKKEIYKRLYLAVNFKIRA